jgi:hypothetical protein
LNRLIEKKTASEERIVMNRITETESGKFELWTERSTKDGKEEKVLTVFNSRKEAEIYLESQEKRQNNSDI